MGSVGSVFVKDPDAVLDYQCDWASWLDDDIIVDSVWVVQDGMTKDSDAYTSTNATIWLSGGTAGVRYSVTNRITTSGGRVDDRSITINVLDR